MRNAQRLIAAIALLPALIAQALSIQGQAGELREEAIVDLVDGVANLAETIAGRDIFDNQKLREALLAALDVRVVPTPAARAALAKRLT